jgi:hypothetical protein
MVHGGRCRVTSSPQDQQESPHLDERAAPRHFDRNDRVGGPRRVAPQMTSRRQGLGPHLFDSTHHQCVEFTGDLSSLGHDCAAGQPFLLSAKNGGAQLEVGSDGASSRLDAACEPGQSSVEEIDLDQLRESCD